MKHTCKTRWPPKACWHHWSMKTQGEKKIPIPQNLNLQKTNISLIDQINVLPIPNTLCIAKLHLLFALCFCFCPFSLLGVKLCFCTGSAGLTGNAVVVVFHTFAPDGVTSQHLRCLTSLHYLSVSQPNSGLALLLSLEQILMISGGKIV